MPPKYSIIIKAGWISLLINGTSPTLIQSWNCKKFQLSQLYVHSTKWQGPKRRRDIRMKHINSLVQSEYTTGKHQQKTDEQQNTTIRVSLPWLLTHWLTCFSLAYFWSDACLVQPKWSRTNKVLMFAYPCLGENWIPGFLLGQPDELLTNLPQLSCLLCITSFFRQLIFKWWWILVPAPVDTGFCQVWITHNLHQIHIWQHVEFERETLTYPRFYIYRYMAGFITNFCYCILLFLCAWGFSILNFEGFF